MILSRRALLRMACAPAPWAAMGQQNFYPVGVGVSSDPYVATTRAVTASGAWGYFDLAGATVVIKPNLVKQATPESGTVTDPEVVRALVDLTLPLGPERIWIAEGSGEGANFDDCGYQFFSTYDPEGRVGLLDLETAPHVVTPVPNGFNYGSLYLPELLTLPRLVFISVAKLKTHLQAAATLSVKNLFALPESSRYIARRFPGRFAMHDRGLAMSIGDLYRAQPIHFAVIDGVWGMEGPGPFSGNAVPMNTVLAGPDAVALDLVALRLMKLDLTRVRYLHYLIRAGQGPASIDQIEMKGDPFRPRAFVIPELPPVVDPPLLQPAAIQYPAMSSTRIIMFLREACRCLVEVVQLSDESPQVNVMRLVAETDLPAGIAAFQWDGRDGSGVPVPPGRYATRISAASIARPEAAPAKVINWVTVW